MTTFLVILLIGAMLATVAALIRGIVTFLKSSSEEVRGGEGPSASSIKSNKMMQARILFQALAIVIVVLLLFAAGKT
ncbi:twin transmembrane helix small protein [Stakelama marina]|uniref:Twin transmembrane helix small protein n=1 Tax=Stakelama marina TaxID=2826939 RepID=A0A8T4IBS0_9SPHN|nr:twin transmembrane helix small protein [Stakelama marina]MBR0552468.1 twin transmembrane helix small protein [Stakelama marina]